MSCRILQGDALLKLPELPDESVHCCVTSPPYWGLRDYGVAGQLGLERTPEEYVSKMVSVFREVKRVLRSDGSLWVNIGDSYNSNSDMTRNDVKAAAGLREQPRKQRAQISSLKPKDLCGVPWLLAFALRADGWYLRQDIIWAKPNPMPESVTDRCTKSHEYIFLLSKSQRYYYDSAAIAEPCLDAEDDLRRISKATEEGKSTPTAERNGIRKSWRGSSFTDERDLHLRPNAGRKRDETPRNDGERWDENNGRGFITQETRNKRSVWTVTTKPFSEAHFATFPPDLIEPCIKAGCPEGGTVLDPFSGAGTTGLVATRFNRNYIGIELNPEYIAMSTNRIVDDAPLFNSVSEFPSEHDPGEAPTGVE